MTTDSPPTSKPQKSGGSFKAKALAARLRAVQALYQKQHNDQSTRSVVQEYLDYRSEMDIDGEPLIPPDGVLFKKIIYGVEERLGEINSIVDANLKKDSSDRKVEPLLRSILMCGAYELLIQEIDFPIVINDYLNVGHAFYERNEVGLINGVLDNIASLFKA